LQLLSFDILINIELTLEIVLGDAPNTQKVLGRDTQDWLVSDDIELSLVVA
jgi:hypothetical protein